MDGETLNIFTPHGFEGLSSYFPSIERPPTPDALLFAPLAVITTNTWIFIGLGVCTVAYLVLRPLMAKRKDPMADAPFRLSISQQRSLERDMQHLTVELAEMTRTMSAQLDTRAARLEALMAEADVKLAKLSAANATAAGSDMTGATPSGSSSASQAAAAETDQPLIAHLSDEETARHARPPAGNRPAMRLVPSEEESNLEAPEGRYRDCYEMADQGFSAHAIAQRLDRPTGEIELILALRPKPAKRAPL